jgi:hypothetical protein
MTDTTYTAVQVPREGTLPRICIDGDWYVDELETAEDCEDAMLMLSEAIINIETRLEELPPGDPRIVKTNAAYKWKRLAVKQVEVLQRKLERDRKNALMQDNDRMFIDWIKANHVDAFDAAAAHFRWVKP